VVIETCSGLRTVVTLTMLTVLLIDLFERRGWHAAILIALAPVVAFLTNGVRVVSLVLNPHSDVASIHNLQGIGMLLVGLTGIYLLDLGIAQVLKSDDRAPVDLAPIRVTGRLRSHRTTFRLLAVSGALVVMIGLRHGIEPWSFARVIEEMPEEVLLRTFDDWTSRALEKDAQFRGSTRFLTWARRSVKVEGRPVDVFLGVAEEQLRRHSVLTPRLAWPASGYEAIEEGRRVLEARARVAGTVEWVAARRTVLRRGARRVLSYSWYERAGSLPAEVLRHAFALDRSPLARPRHVLAVRLSTQIGYGGADRGRIDEAEARIRLVYERLAPELKGFAATFPDRQASLGSD